MEKPSTSKCIRVSSSADRISGLPDDLRCRILSCLPTKVYAKTCVLSRKWKTLWTKVPVIDFEEDRDRSTAADTVQSLSFVESVKSAVFNSERLEKLRVKGLPTDDDDGDRDSVHVPELVTMAIAKKVRFLDLQLYKSELGYVFPLPDALFCNDQLESLSLSGYFELELPSVVSLPRLQVLKLSHVFYDQEDFIPELISGSPVLDHLYIYQNHLDSDRCYRISSSSLRSLEFHFDHHDCSDHEGTVGRLEIDAPKLEHLVLADFLCRVVTVARTASLVSATLYLTCMVDWDGGFEHGPDERFNSTVQLVESLNTVEFLRIREDAMMALSLATAPISSHFERLTVLHIDMDCCYWSCLSGIVSHAIRLRVLKLTKFLCDNYQHQVCWVDPERVPECLSSSLAQVLIKGIQGSEDDMAMVRYILGHGAALTSVNLVSARELGIEEKFRAAQQILTFPRASGAYSIAFE